ncbi:steroidogenic acute regulatory protein-like [Hyalella azteca]|uniref:Steroidogenic acute regulatory protein-like n=1 Tax=Hyalella azteca TaxID=294128 RepID=A0A8B7PRL7_HYAAZ|nr:steroidogenic acute regulatory protein-like [Hyalella azteca]
MNILPVSQHGSLQSLLGQSSSTINTEQQDLLLANYNLPGLRVDGRMSAARRFFCLFVFFDLLFTSVFWIICVLIDGQSIKDGLIEEIVNYTFATSMFDMVVCSMIRFSLLLLVYALIHIQHYWMVAVTTMLSSAFYVAKSLLFEWKGSPDTGNSSSNYPFLVVLVLISFLLAWAEVWLIDFSVLPQEARAKNLIRALTSRGPGSVSGQQDATARLRDYISQCAAESVANFYSPLQSPYVFCQENVWLCLGVEALLRNYDLLRTPGWDHHSRTPAGDVITVRSSPAGRKIFRLAAPLKAPAQLIFKDVVDDAENMPSWNSALMAVRKVQSLSGSSDVVHQISADVSGLVKSRDFVMVRHWRRIQGGPLDEWTSCWISSVISIVHPQVPVDDRYVRGENGPGCWSFCESSGASSASECMFYWIMETDLKGWLPKRIVESAITSVMSEQVEALRRRAAALTQLKTQLTVNYPNLAQDDDNLLRAEVSNSFTSGANASQCNSNRNSSDDALLV